MFEHTVTFTDFNGDEDTEKLCFNLTVPEIAELEFEFDEGFQAYILEAVKKKSNRKLFLMFKLLMKASYGRRTPDGKGFVKKQAWIEELFSGKAYEELFIWLFSNEENAATFFSNVVPSREEMQKRLRTDEKVTDPSQPKPPRIQDMTQEQLVAMIEAGTVPTS